MIEKSLSYVYRPRGYADGGSVVQVTSPTNPKVQVTQPVSEPVPNSPEPQKSLADITTMAVGEEDMSLVEQAKITTLAVGEEDGTVAPDIPESGFRPVTTAAVGEEEGIPLEKPYIIVEGPGFEVTTQAVGEEDGAISVIMPSPRPEDLPTYTAKPVFNPSNFGPVAVSQPVTQDPSLFNKLGGGTSGVFNRATSLDYVNPFLRKPGDPL